MVSAFYRTEKCRHSLGMILDPSRRLVRHMCLCDAWCLVVQKRTGCKTVDISGEDFSQTEGYGSPYKCPENRPYALNSLNLTFFVAG
jgi:hypothetical protein